ncbi:MAG TPA: methyltransferase domain-containing protein [Acidimicrobiales bacterium]|nr:methyltransferase domain-containing protein [Acidimicrobiales bacterium]
MALPENRGTDAAYLREHQYKDPSNLSARIALHARFSQSEQPWYPWLTSLVDWPEDGDVLEVGCGPGTLWLNVAALLPPLRLTLTDLSVGMLAAAREAVAPLPSLEVVATTACDAQALPFPDRSFDVVVANHMLYHVPDPSRAVSEFARVLRSGGVLVAATNGPNHLDVITELSRQFLGSSTTDFVDRRFGTTNGAAILSDSFGSVTWYPHACTIVCDEPSAVLAYVTSSGAGHAAAPEQLDALAEAVHARFREAGGVLRISTEKGCFVARP